jgi:hypothetical protein
MGPAKSDKTMAIAVLMRIRVDGTLRRLAGC